MRKQFIAWQRVAGSGTSHKLTKPVNAIVGYSKSTGSNSWEVFETTAQTITLPTSTVVWCVASIPHHKALVEVVADRRTYLVDTDDLTAA
jgi:hypothetical protein